jgi:hypothetical protein
MKTCEPTIQPLPTEAEFLAMVDTVLEPGECDREARALIGLLMTVANPECDSVWYLATAAARHAFAKTNAFETAFREFAGYPERSRPKPRGPLIVHATEEM